MGESVEIEHIDDNNFDDKVINASKPVLVDYWAEWCKPCHAIAPILEEVAQEYDGKVKVCKLNIDQNADCTAKFAVRAIPTLMLFKNGNVEATKTGLLTKSELIAFLDSNI